MEFALIVTLTLQEVISGPEFSGSNKLNVCHNWNQQTCTV